VCLLDLCWFLLIAAYLLDFVLFWFGVFLLCVGIIIVLCLLDVMVCVFKFAIVCVVFDAYGCSG